MASIRRTLKTVRDAIDSKKGEDIVILDISKISSFADYFVICTASNPRQSSAIVDEIQQQLGKLGIHPLHIEGRRSNDWVLLDYAQLVVHIFSPSYREFYALEKLWRDGRLITEQQLSSRKRLP